MKKNKNHCSAYVTFKREFEVKTVELCGITEAAKYITNVILEEGWQFISMTRGTEYQTALNGLQQEVYDTLKNDAALYGEDNQFTIEASHFGGTPFKVVMKTIKELEDLGFVTLFPKKSCYFDGKINNI